MSYQIFASYYDELMQDVPYETWVDMTIRAASDAGISSGSLLDVGCGTGTLTRMLAKHFSVSGLDLSADMLAIAGDRESDVRMWFEGDMRDFDLGLTFDVVTSFVDSVNYVTDEEEVRAAFRSIRRHVRDGGLFLFDVHSQHKMREVFPHFSFSDKDEVKAWMWHVFPGEVPDEVEHELTFFVAEADGRYARHDEWHVQRTFAPNVYESYLKQAGFNVKQIVPMDDEDGEPERLFFVCEAVLSE
ncbi:MAG: class I SAM-dependent DNA methyltransferase [Bacilli bacterium]